VENLEVAEAAAILEGGLNRHSVRALAELAYKVVVWRCKQLQSESE